MMRFRWSALARSPRERPLVDGGEAAEALGLWERPMRGAERHLLAAGHKGDLMLGSFPAHFRGVEPGTDAVGALALSDYLEPTASYVSMVELDLYESSTDDSMRRLARRNIKPHSESGSAKSKPCSSATRKAMGRACGPSPPANTSLLPMDRRARESERIGTRRPWATGSA